MHAKFLCCGTTPNSYSASVRLPSYAYLQNRFSQSDKLSFHNMILYSDIHYNLEQLKYVLIENALVIMLS